MRRPVFIVTAVVITPVLLRLLEDLKFQKQLNIVTTTIRDHRHDEENKYHNHKYLPVDKYTKNFVFTPPAPNGTLVVFFHLGKSGGTAIRNNVEDTPGIKYLFSQSLSKYKEDEKKLYKSFRGDNSMLNAPNKTIFIEIHEGDAPSFMHMKEKLQSWRELSLESGVNFFAFTIIRDPLSQSISHFNDHCLKRKKKCHISTNMSMVDSFILSKEVVNNYQTRFYTRQNKVRSPYLNMYDTIHQDKSNYSRSPSSSFSSSSSSQEDAREVFTAMVELLDWVGTTECIANDTFPILRHVVPSYNPETFLPYNVGTTNHNIRDEGLAKDMLTKSQIEYLHKIMRPDYELFHNATHHFGSNCPSVLLSKDNFI